MFPYFEYNANCVVLAPFLFQPISAVFNNNKKKMENRCSHCYAISIQQKQKTQNNKKRRVIVSTQNSLQLGGEVCGRPRKSGQIKHMPHSWLPPQ